MVSITPALQLEVEMLHLPDILSGKAQAERGRVRYVSRGPR